MQIKKIKIVISLLIISLASGCGFQLRGSGDALLAGKKIMIESKLADRQLKKILTRRLQVSGAEVLKGMVDTSETVIVVSLEKLDETSRGSLRDVLGQANEHELTLTLMYQINKVKPQVNTQIHDDMNTPEQDKNEVSGKSEKALEKLSVNSSFYQNANQPVGFVAQQNQTRQTLLEKLANHLVTQLAYQQEY
ncbi:MAG: hypothetical protein OEY19_11850 [Gammaproteobacteria bacterium]|nr:hypothetical protein [Gammaproteobacteria bacterium]MDH5629641.1 hypothetical protein [Gammaproteobacteria bacterium]